MNEPPQDNQGQPQTGKFKIDKRIVIGFLGWFLVNGLLWLWLTRQANLGTGQYGAGIYGIYIFPANLLALIVLLLVKKTRRYGQGMLAAIGVNLLISLILGQFLNAACFIPYFTHLD